jgi:hypothetical protein
MKYELWRDRLQTSDFRKGLQADGAENGIEHTYRLRETDSFYLYHERLRSRTSGFIIHNVLQYIVFTFVDIVI